MTSTTTNAVGKEGVEELDKQQMQEKEQKGNNCGEHSSTAMEVDNNENESPDITPTTANGTSKHKTGERNKTISAAKVESLKDQMKYLLNRHRLLEQDVFEVNDT